MLNALALALSSICILFLPGWALLTRILLPSEKGQQRRFIDDFFFVIFTSFLISTIAGISLALLGAFNFSVLFLLDLLISLVIYLTRRAKKSSLDIMSYKLTWQDVLLLNLILIATFFYLFPAEDIFGGLDSGVYVNTGVNLVKEGKVTFTDPLMQKLPENIHSEAVSVFKLDGYGVYFKTDDKKELVGQFLPGYPVWLAIAYSLSGLKGFLYVTPIIALVGLIAVYLAGSYLFSKTAALIGVTLLSTNILNLWFSRQPLSETMANLLIWGGIYYLARFLKEKKEIFAQIAGVSFGVAFLVRLDSILLLIPLCIIFLYYRYKGFQEKGRYQTFVIIASFFIVAALASLFYYKNYFNLLTIYFLNLNLTKQNGHILTEQFRLEHLIMLSAAIFILLVLITLYRHSEAIKKRALLLRVRKEHLLTAAAGLLSALFIFQLFIRPSLPFRFMSPQANSLKRLGWYFMPLKAIGLNEQPIYNNEFRFLSDILVLFFGFCIVYTFLKVKHSYHFFTFLVFFVYSSVYFNNLMTVPNHFWLNRRFITVILPYTFLAAGFFLSNLLKKNRFLKVVSLILFASLLLFFIDGSSLILRHKEMGGAVAQTEKIANNMKDDALYIMDAEPELQYHLPVLPLKYFFNKSVVLFEANAQKVRKFLRLLPELRQHFSSIFFCTLNRKNLADDRLFLVQEGWNEILVRRFEQTSNIDYRPPHKRLDMRITFETYRLEEKSNLSKNIRMLDVGTGGEIFLSSGFYNVEKWEDMDVRWTMGEFSFYLPRPIDYNTVTIRMSNGRPLHIKPPQVTLYFSRFKLGEFYVLQDMADYKIRIPQTLIDDLSKRPYFRLRGKSDTWMPKEAGVNKDVRLLGVVIDHITLSRESDIK